MFPFLLGITAGYIAFTESGRKTANSAVSRVIDIAKQQGEKVLGGLKPKTTPPSESVEDTVI